MHSLRLDGESDEDFRARAERTGRIARVLVEACLRNRQIQRLIAEGKLAEKSIRTQPTVRVEYEQAVAIGGIGETLEATKHKHWGAGPWILPLEPDDEFYEQRITYIYRPSSLYNRRYEQRMRLKELLGKHRKLVGEAKWHTKTIFLRDLTERQARAIRRLLSVEPGDFWRACKGKIFLRLPPRIVQREFDFGD